MRVRRRILRRVVRNTSRETRARARRRPRRRRDGVSRRGSVRVSRVGRSTRREDARGDARVPRARCARARACFSRGIPCRRTADQSRAPSRDARTISTRPTPTGTGRIPGAGNRTRRGSRTGPHERRGRRAWTRAREGDRSSVEPDARRATSRPSPPRSTANVFPSRRRRTRSTANVFPGDDEGAPGGNADGGEKTPSVVRRGTQRRVRSRAGGVRAPRESVVVGAVPRAGVRRPRNLRRDDGNVRVRSPVPRARVRGASTDDAARGERRARARRAPRARRIRVFPVRGQLRGPRRSRALRKGADRREPNPRR